MGDFPPALQETLLYKMSTKIKAHELRSKGKNDLVKQLDELKTELQSLKVQKVANANSSKLTKITAVRKGIARINTVMTAKTRESLREHYKNKKYLPLDLRAKKTRALRRKLTKNEERKVTLRQKKRQQAFPTRKFALKA